MSNLLSELSSFHNVYSMVFIMVLVIYGILTKSFRFKNKNNNLTIKRLLYKRTDIKRDSKTYRIMFYTDIAFIILMLLTLCYLININDWVYVIIYSIFLIIYIIIFYELISYPHLFKKDYFPSYVIGDKTFIILTIINNKMLTTIVNHKELNKFGNKIYRINPNSRRYLENVSLLNHHSVKYIKNDILKCNHNIKENKVNKHNVLSLNNIFLNNKIINNELMPISTLILLILIFIYYNFQYWIQVINGIPLKGNNRKDLIYFLLSSTGLDVKILEFTFLILISFLIYISWKSIKYSYTKDIDRYDTIWFISMISLYIMYFYVLMIPILLFTDKVILSLENHLNILNKGIMMLLLSIFPFMFVFSLLHVFKLMNEVQTHKH